MEDSVVSPDADAVVKAKPVQPVAPLPEAAQHTETVGVPDAPNAIEDIQKLIPAGGDASIFTVLLAVVGVAGGGAAWKFYQQRIKLNHEVRMKELELKANEPKQEDNHQKCAAERQALEAKLVALESKFAEIEKKQSASEFEFSPEDWGDRLDKIEKLVGAIKKPSKKVSR